MISPSACQHWQPDRQLIPAQKSRSYTTRRDTIRVHDDQPWARAVEGDHLPDDQQASPAT